MIPVYNVRIAKMDTGKGISNKMIQEAMKAEIMELRKAVRDSEKVRSKALAAQYRTMSKLVKAAMLERDEAKARADEWRGHATRYQKQLAAKR